MLQKKICMLGGSAVGKTSIVARFVRSIFQDKYLTTVGVKIDRKPMDLDGQQLNIMLWDIEGDDEFQNLSLQYLRGASGYLLVADGTRRPTLDQALMLQQTVQKELGELPFVLALNKADLKDQWLIKDEVMGELISKGWDILETSAKTGQGVEEAFGRLARGMLGV
jgi:hypothetical protein